MPRKWHSWLIVTVAQEPELDGRGACEAKDMALVGTITAGTEKAEDTQECMNQRERSNHLSRHPQGWMRSQDGVSGGVPGDSGKCILEASYVRSQEGHWEMSSPAWRLTQGWGEGGQEGQIRLTRRFGLSAN